jgi:hypothetical protein
MIYAAENETISFKREMPTEFFTHNYYDDSIEKTEHGTLIRKILNENFLKVDLLKYQGTSERITLR